MVMVLREFPTKTAGTEPKVLTMVMCREMAVVGWVGGLVSLLYSCCLSSLHAFTQVGKSICYYCTHSSAYLGKPAMYTGQGKPQLAGFSRRK